MWITKGFRKMSVTPTNAIDKRLAQLYLDKVTVNLDRQSPLSADEFWSSMELIAVNNKAFMNFKK